MLSRATWLAVFLALVAYPFVAQAADEIDVLGSWQAILIEHGTEKQQGEKIEKVVLTFEKDKVISDGNEGNDPKVSFTYKIDQSEALKKVDFEALDGLIKGKKIPGIIRKDGENLQICVVIGDGDAVPDRPTDFAARIDRPWILVTLKPKK